MNKGLLVTVRMSSSHLKGGVTFHKNPFCRYPTSSGYVFYNRHCISTLGKQPLYLHCKAIMKTYRSKHKMHLF